MTVVKLKPKKLQDDTVTKDYCPECGSETVDGACPDCKPAEEKTETEAGKENFDEQEIE